MLLDRRIKMPQPGRDAVGEHTFATFCRAVFGRVVGRTADPANGPSARAMFESRYENELFLAEELMARGGALSPEDHAWLTKLIAAYEATSTTAPGDEAAPQIEDPWAVDTRPGIFETQSTVGAVVASESPSSDDDVVSEARKLRQEAAATRAELRSELAMLSRERQRLRRAASDLRQLIGRGLGTRADIDLPLSPAPGGVGDEDEPGPRRQR
jgi:hypothetical protein